MKSPNQLTSFTFQGLNQSGRWVVLDERRFPYPVLLHFTTRAFFVDTDEYFTHFRFVPEGGMTFSLSAFEIHGEIAPISCESPDSEGTDETDCIDEEFDPWSLADYE
jgi:hypothetical protein